MIEPDFNLNHLNDPRQGWKDYKIMIDQWTFYTIIDLNLFILYIIYKMVSFIWANSTSEVDGWLKVDT